MKRTIPSILSILALGAGLGVVAGCGSGGGSSSTTAANSYGPIKIWYSNNAQEIAWGEQMVASWNKAHPSQKITGVQIPTGKSSEDVIGAAITAGTEPCLIFNTSPASVPQFTQEGGLVPLNNFPGAASYIQARSGAATAKQYTSGKGVYYQMPWKSNPVMIFYNKKIFAKAGISTTNPPLQTYAQFLATAKKVVASHAAKYAIYPAPTSEFFQPWFDFYPLFAAATGGKELVQNGSAQFDSAAGGQVVDFWRTIYADGLAGKDTYTGDSFADGTAAMAIVGPWAISAYNKVNWGEVPVPTAQGLSQDQTHTYSDAKNIGMYASCKNQGTAWNVLKYATSEQQDGKLLEMTGQMPIRANLQQVYASYFSTHPAYQNFAAEAGLSIGVPQVTQSIEIWQDFRNNWEKYVISGQGSTQQFLSQTATSVNKLAAQS